jgi:hypothetical protein
MDRKEGFWKEASKKIDFLLSNPIRFHNEDLLQQHIEEPRVFTSKEALHSPYKAKFSSFNSRYTNYKPAVMKILNNSRKFIVSRSRYGRSPSPFVRRININDFSDYSISPEGSSLEVYGQRAGFSFLPKLSSPSKIKVFLVNVREKYSKLFSQLKDEDGVIRPQGILDYLTMKSSMKKFVPKAKLLDANRLRSESMMRRTRHLNSEKEYLNHVQDQAQAIIVLEN